MSQPPLSATPGQRVAFYRRRAGLTQRQLSHLVGRSKDWTGKIESRAWELNRLPILQKLADTLGVSVADLNPAVATQSHRDQPASPYADRTDPSTLLAALSSYPELAQLRQPPSERDIPLPHTLRHRLDSLGPLLQRGDHRHLVATLAHILPQIDQGATRARRSQLLPRWQQAQATAYTAAAQVLSQLGQPAGAWVAADRANKAAIATADWRQAATATLSVAQILLSQDRLDEALSAALAIQRALKATTSHDTQPAQLALAGATHLIVAKIHARQRNAEHARQELRHAERLATQLTRPHHQPEAGFGPATVALTALDIALTLEEPGAALDIADRTDPTTLTPDQHARVLLAAARAHIQRRDPNAAINTLLQAETVAPDLIHHHPDSLDTVRDLGALAKRVRNKELAALRQRIESTS
jgi:transcriptional regulator with XRE-family HTH domain